MNTLVNPFLILIFRALHQKGTLLVLLCHTIQTSKDHLLFKKSPFGRNIVEWIHLHDLEWKKWLCPNVNPIVRNAKAKVDASIGVNLNSMKWQWNPDFWSHFCQQNWESFLSCFASPIVVYVVKFKNARRELKSSGTFVRNRWLDNWPWAYNGAQQQRLEHWHENWLSAALIDTPSCLREVFVVASSSAAILVPRSRAIETVNYLTDIEFLDLLKQASILANQYTVQHCIISATPTRSADERSERIRKDINLILHWRHNSKEGSEGKKKNQDII